MQTDSFLEEIRQLENCRSITTTRDYIGLHRLNYDQPFIEFRPSMTLLWCISIIVGSLFLTVVAHLMITAPSLNSHQITGHITAALLFLTVLAITYKQQHLDKTKNYKIRIDSTGIRIADNLFQWDSIHETAIMNTGGQHPTIYLVIAMKASSSYECYTLTNFPTSYYGFATKLSQYIEHFKPA